MGWISGELDGAPCIASGACCRPPVAFPPHRPPSNLPSCPSAPQITAEVKNVLGTLGSGVQEVIANTKGTVSSLFGKGATSTPSFSMT